MCLPRVLFVFGFFLSACSPIHYSQENVPPIPAPVVIDLPAPCVALVLGGGGSRALAHLGVLEVLEEEGIPIDLIVGCSGGAIIGALYADREDAKYLKNLLFRLRKEDLLDVHYFDCHFGPIHGKHLHKFLCNHLNCKLFENLKIPFIAVATDLFSGELVLFGSGPIIPAVQASSAIPGIFRPLRAYGRYFVDGSVLNPVPVEVAKSFGAQMIIAVDIGEELSDTPICNFFDVSLRSLHICLLKLSEYSVCGADVLIKPQFADMGLFSDCYNSEIYEKGKQAGLEAIPKIRKLLENMEMKDEEK